MLGCHNAMNLQGVRASLIGCLFSALLLAGRVDAAAAWEGLPPTPHLPKARVSGFAPVNGVRLFFSRFGSGRPLLLLHGGLANSNYWGDVIPFWVANGFEVIVVDSRGHGRSTRSDSPFSYELMAADIVSLLKYLELPRVDLVGWSDGGIVGIDLAIHHPARLKRMAIYGTNSDPSGIRPHFDTTDVFARYLARARTEYEQLSPTPQDFDRFVGQIEMMWANQPRYSSLDLGRISTPTLVFDGAHDEAIKRDHTEYLAHEIPGASLVVLDDVSHFGMLQNPSEFAGTVADFLLAHGANPPNSNSSPGSRQ